MKKMTEVIGNRSIQTYLFKTGNLFFKIGRYFSKRSTIVEIICSLLIILFIYTGINKIMDFEEFKFQLTRSPYVKQLSGIISYALPSIELLIVLALVFNGTRIYGLYASFFLMTLFSGYVWIMLTFSPYLPCSCGGILNRLNWNEHLWVNIGYTIISLVGLLIQNNIISNRNIN